MSADRPQGLCTHPYRCRQCGKTMCATAVQMALYAGSLPYDIDTDTRGEWAP